jgi:hypothetical protein
VLALYLACRAGQVQALQLAASSRPAAQRIVRSRTIFAVQQWSRAGEAAGRVTHAPAAGAVAALELGRAGALYRPPHSSVGGSAAFARTATVDLYAA